MDPTTAQQQRFEHIASLLDPEHSLDSLRAASDKVVNTIYNNIPRGISNEDLDRRLCIQAEDASDASLPLLMEDARLSLYAPEDLQALLRDARGFSLETLSSANPNQSWDKVFSRRNSFVIDNENILVAAENFRMFWRHNPSALGSVSQIIDHSDRFTIAGLTGDLIRQLDTVQARRNVGASNIFSVVLRLLARHILTGRFNIVTELENGKRSLFSQNSRKDDDLYDPRIDGDLYGTTFLMDFSRYFRSKMKSGNMKTLISIQDHFEFFGNTPAEDDVKVLASRRTHDREMMSPKLVDVFFHVAGVAAERSDREPLPFLLDILAFFRDLAEELGLPPVSNPLETVL